MNISTRCILFEQKGDGMSGRWPSNFCLTHDPGCERVGVKRVKTKDGHKTDPVGHLGAFDDGQIYGKGKGLSKEGRKYITDGMETVDDWRCVEGCPVRRLGEQGGERRSGGRKGLVAHKWTAKGRAGIAIETPAPREPDTGTAARFYFQADWSYERIEEKELWNGGVDDNL